MYGIELLQNNNYDTWKLQARAALVKNGLWGYVSGKNVPPTEESLRQVFEECDEKAKAELVLLISSSELRTVKNAKSSKELWTILENMYESTGPARKATLLKRLVLKKMRDDEDIREYLAEFMDTVDKLQSMEIPIHVRKF